MKTGTLIPLNHPDRLLKKARDYLADMDVFAPDLQLDALSALAMIPLSTTILDGYRRFLVDEDPRIRRQVLENLSTKDPADYDPLKDSLHLLLADKDAQVRQAAIRLFVRTGSRLLRSTNF